MTGEIEQPHVRLWSTVLRVPTAGGPVWFKAAQPAFAHEARVLQLLQPLAPALLPEPLAVRDDDGWLLLPDAGERARERPVEWRPLLAAYAELQIASAACVDALLAAGAHDLRLAAVPERIEEIERWLSAESVAGLRARLPEVRGRLAVLEGSPLPVTVDHGDLHDGNVFVRDGRVRILDWGDSGVAHPFFSLTVEMEPGARDAYLEPFTVLAARRELDAEVEAVVWLRYLLRALNWHLVAELDPSFAEQIDLRVRYFLGLADVPRSGGLGL